MKRLIARVGLTLVFLGLLITSPFAQQIVASVTYFTLGTTLITLGQTFTTIAGLTLTAPTFTGATSATGTLQVTGVLTPTGGEAAAGGFSASPRNVSTCGLGPNSATSAYTAQTPVATEFYFAEIFIPANVTVTGVAVFNSATISGNLKVGLANSAGANVATSASTAMSGTSAYQLVPFTGTYAAVGPATYFVEVFYDNATARPNTLTAGSCGVSKATAQVFATGFTAITPPTTFTTALGPVASVY